MDWPTILVALLLGIIFVAIVATQLRNRKQGKSACACGGNCGACGGCGQYHSQE
jgi:hypothetical protein